MIFFLLLLLFFIFAICWGDSIYNASKGITKYPLLDTYIIVTESMLPAITVNDAVVIKRVKNNTLEIGDIITFSIDDVYFNKMIITHRIVEKKLDVDGNYVYRTKGDNNFSEDNFLVDLDSIYGKVILKLPKVGYIHKFVSSPFGFVTSIIIPILGLIFYEIWRIFRIRKQRYSEVEI